MNSNNISKLKRILACVFLGILFLSKECFIANAEEIGFYVETIESENQLDPSKDIYYIQTKPGENQELEVRLTSKKKEAVEINIGVMNAITSPEGAIAFSEKKEDISKSLKFPITSIVSPTEKKVVLENFESKIITFKINPENENYEGVKAGSLIFTQKGDSKSGLSTDYAYRVGILLSESGDNYKDSTSLNLEEAKATLYRKRKVMQGILNNVEPKFLEGLSVKGVVKNKKTGDIVLTKNVENYQLAPNSQLIYNFDIGIDDVKSGTYVMELKAENSLEKWDLKKEFIVTGDDAKKINNESPYRLVTPTWIKICTVLLALVQIITILYLVKRKNKREKKWKKLSIDRKRRKKN